MHDTDAIPGDGAAMALPDWLPMPPAPLVTGADLPLFAEILIRHRETGGSMRLELTVTHYRPTGPKWSVFPVGNLFVSYRLTQ